MKRCIFVSFFNSYNIGDLLISEMLSKTIEKEFQIVKCSFEGSFNIIGNNTIQNSKASLIYKITQKITDKINNFIFWRKFKSQLKISDCLIIGGGNMIMSLSQESKSIQHFADYINLAKKLNKPIFVICVGVGPFKNLTQRKYATSILSKCNYVTYRDEDSLALIGLGDFSNHYISIDPVFLLENSSPKGNLAKKRKSVIGICIINPMLFSTSKETYNMCFSGYLKLINELLKKEYNVIVFSTEKNDYFMIDEILSQFETDQLKQKTINSLAELLQFYKEIDFLIGTRMHAMIIAYTQLIPMIGLSWQKKIDSFFGIIGEDNTVFPINNISNLVEDIIHQMETMIGNTGDKYNMEKINDIKKKFEINIKILQELAK